ncbi:MAG: cation:proton antiporter [Candidatus Gastranaerophilales bacterium]|nr:cation:proton antiporter [Candidatus Gastranaerophilales bacterium]
MIETTLIEIAVMVAVGLLIAGLASILKQPLIIGYIIAGIVLGPNILNLAHASDAIGSFAQLGVVVLLFTVGLNLSPKVFREVGKVSLITGLGQVLFTSLIGMGIAYALGYSIISSLYIAVALTFSSTIIIMKILSDKGDIDALYGKISIGFLLVQDVVAMIILAVVSSISSASGESMTTLDLIAIIAISLALIPIAIYIMPKILKKIAKSQEYLLLFSIGWCLVIAAIFFKLKFSMEIGALLAGVTLSMSKYRHEVVAKIKPIRDFFIFIFFVHLGSQMNITNLENSLIPIIVFSLFILIGNPLIVLIIMGRLGYASKTGFLAGLTVAQISEFSLILIAMGVKNSGLPEEVLSMVTVVGLITIAGSTYAMLYSEKIYPRISKFLSIFERKNLKYKEVKSNLNNLEVVMFGCDKIGYSLLKVFKDSKTKLLVVEFNPEVIKYLDRKRINCIYGDAEDSETLDNLNLHKTKMVISTIPSYEINSLILHKVREASDSTITIMVCNSIEDSLKLYDRGASYVIIPRYLGGEYASSLILKHGFNLEKFMKEKVSHIEKLGDRKDIIHFNK